MGKKNRKLWASVLVFSLVIVIGVGIIFRQPVKNQLNDWKLLPEPEKLTELYFNNSANLPTTYVPGTLQTTSFEVHNLEYQTWTYNYTVSAVAIDNSITKLQAGSFTLSQDQYKSVPIILTMPNLGPRVQIEVTLASPNQSIDYWVTRSGS